MEHEVTEVLNGQRKWWVSHADCLEYLRLLPEDSIDLVFGSPPYEAQRSYGIGFNKKGQDWVDWMVAVFREASRVCRGLIATVVEGFTKDYRWSATPALLLADLHRAGFHLRKPPVYCRNGIPGSGGPDWLRNDWEWIVCVTRPGRLPWSDNTVMGHLPKWGPEEAMSHRLSDGSRVNQWGMNGKISYRADGKPIKKLGHFRPSHVVKTGAISGKKQGDTCQDGVYKPPVLANPGNLIRCVVGGNNMGSPLCHDNEAPFSEHLAEFFARSFCPPGGLVCDPFAGSGTTLASAIAWQRRALGCDVRSSQVQLTRQRVEGVTPTLFPEESG